MLFSATGFRYIGSFLPEHKDQGKVIYLSRSWSAMIFFECL
jgi:hypothetical protein